MGQSAPSSALEVKGALALSPFNLAFLTGGGKYRHGKRPGRLARWFDNAARRNVLPTLRLADLLASVSLVADLGFALPPEESMRTCIIGTAVARRLGLDEATVSDVFYTSLLQHIGCTGFAHETSAIYGNELAINAALSRTNPDDLRSVLGNFVLPAMRGRGPVGGSRIAIYTITRGDQFGRRYATAVCEVGRETARRLGLPEGVHRGLYDVVEAWNGKTGPRGLKGDEISIVARIAAVASVASHFDELGGVEAARDALERMAGHSMDPVVVVAFVDGAEQILPEARAGDPREGLLAAEPAPARTVSDADLAGVLAAVADIADLKSTFTLGHSCAVADLAEAAAIGIGLDADVRRRLRVAALLHDVGRVGISNAVWERPGPLTSGGWEQVRLHPYHSERILARSEALSPMAPIAGMHHERLDGSGYHRGARARDIPLEARLLAAADAFQAVTQDRPHRAALGAEEAAALLHEDAGTGRLDHEAVEAVIGAAGLERRGRRRPERPGGLTDREVEVLRLVARGMSNREVASQLVVSGRTAEHHVQHIYDKIGVSSRAAAALFAMEHGLLD
jgi:HD-GYP domain-containing protein (c-di-GMP phosphodiesterase class II)